MSVRAMYTGLIVVALLTVSCGKSEDVSAPAPIGELATLERLAGEYERIAATMPMSPSQLPAKQRKAFVERVFAESGYSYSATLHQMAEGAWDTREENAKELARLLMFPHVNLRPEDSLSGVYSEQEQADIARLEALLQ